MSCFEPENKDTYIPYVIETSIGLDRLILSLLCSAYKEEKVKGESRVVWLYTPGWLLFR